MFKKSLSVFIALIFISISVFAQRDLGVRPTESGGVLMREQAVFDVKHYDLAVTPNIEEKSIKGILTMTAQIVGITDKIVLDLDTPLTVESVSLIQGKKQTPLKFERREGKIWISLLRTMRLYEIINVRVAYSGIPKPAPRPPWVGGFVWSKTKDGEPWFATAVQNDGADLWFPVKDHPSDKADTVSLHFTVSANLVAASNGKLKSVIDNKNSTKTFNWEVSQPISNYCIALNVAPYKLLEDEVKSITGEMIPIKFYILPQDEAKGKSLIELTKKYNAFYEKYLGPYPFRADKIGIVETPHLGMEHQSITAYGNEFKYNADGDDTLMFHEFGHEWWANLVTAPDWNDFWIHEGFQSFMDTFYLETTKGKDAYFKAMKNRVKGLKNVKPVAPREARTTTEMYLMPPDYTKSDGDIYGKGSLVLHTLRYYIGDDAFFRSIRRMAYPDPKMEKVSDGKQFHFATTDDFLKIAEKESGKKLDWFFELYLRQSNLPRLISERNRNQLNLSWDTPNLNTNKLKDYEIILGLFGARIYDPMPFPMPVEVSINGMITKVEMKNGEGSISVPQDAKIEIDPFGWILKEQ